MKIVCDVVVIGAGMYGLYCAKFLSSQKINILILEQDSSAFLRASKINQARFHNGLHYPRAQRTVTDILKYRNRFIEEFEFCLNRNFDAFYAISSDGSLTSAVDFLSFMKENHIPYVEKDPLIYFNKDRIDALYLTEEYTYDYNMLREYFLELIETRKIKIIFNNSIQFVENNNGTSYIIKLENGMKIETYGIVNATYASINIINQLFNKKQLDLKYELCEIILCRVPQLMKNKGFTVMDGDFFSIMPFGFSEWHSLTSVHHTPHHVSKNELRFPCMKNELKCCQNRLLNCNFCLNKPNTSYLQMKELIQEYLRPELSNVKFKETLFTIKPVPIESECTDNRPTIIQLNETRPFFLSVLAGKFTTFYELDDYLYRILRLL